MSSAEWVELSPLQRVVTAANKSTGSRIPRFNPREGRGSLFRSLGDAKGVPEPSAIRGTEKPSAVLIPGTVHVVHDAEAGGEQNGQGS